MTITRKLNLERPPRGGFFLRHNVRYWHLADIPEPAINVRFWGKSGHRLVRCTCLLLTQSGHSLIRRNVTGKQTVTLNVVQKRFGPPG